MPDHRSAPLAPVPPPGAVSPAPRVVLVAEDDDSVRDLVRVALERAGYAVVAMADGQEALDLFLPDPARFDLVLSDVVMPGRNGPELAAALLAVRPDLRVLFMSAYTGTCSSRPTLLPAGHKILEKPFTVGQLLAAVAREIAGDQVAAGG